MNVNEYISSGILDCYVLGAVSPQEKQEVECMSHIYPEIREEILRLQQAAEKLAESGSVAPPPSVKKNILAKIQSVSQEKETKIIPVNKNRNFLPWIITAAAASIAFVVFFIKQNEVGESKKELASMKSKMEKMEEDYLTLDATMISLNDLNVHMSKELEMFRNPDFKTVFLASTHTLSEGSKAIICWNKKNHSVMIAAESMPEKPSQMDYQLWALVDGKPMSLGVLPAGMNSNFIVLDSIIENPDGFAITLENKGGSEVPTLDKMYLAGNL